MDFEQTFADIDATLTNVVGNNLLLDGLPVKALFTDPWQEPEVGQLRTDIVEPIVEGLESELGGAIEGTSKITKDGAVYTVIRNPPAVNGITTLALRPDS